MDDTAMAFVTPADAPRWKRWLVYSPLARIVIFALIFLLLSIIAGAAVGAIGWTAKGAPPLQRAGGQLLVNALPALLAYLVLVLAIERRAPAELSLRTLLPKAALGLLGGLVLFSTVVAVLWLLGVYHVTGLQPDAPWLPALLVVGLGAGIGEEIISRGVLFRITEEGLGTWPALAVSAAFFGAAHIANPGATVWSSAAIAIEAGLLFGMLYHVTRSLPLCMGVHAAWNFAQGTIYGIPVSGMAGAGWLQSHRTGPDWLSGGSFGAEASVVALAVCSLVTVALVRVARRRGSLVPLLARNRARRLPSTAAHR
ncbi:type II CAAX endopeptidase family protein [Dyella sp.]|uniref:CPBP family intramembrane glutamic endopeptidase n=1 Tax=Dyella sp. TaxID=1869338 RepID=UPI002D789A51|nr:type II CAAX endopeptidase family protein [Dyella sp.]HET6430769.1 type II CAAX endopeptidase family protein [Dyella sp.]